MRNRTDIYNLKENHHNIPQRRTICGCCHLCIKEHQQYEEHHILLSLFLKTGVKKQQLCTLFIKKQSSEQICTNSQLPSENAAERPSLIPAGDHLWFYFMVKLKITIFIWNILCEGTLCVCVWPFHNPLCITSQRQKLQTCSFDAFPSLNFKFLWSFMFNY